MIYVFLAEGFEEIEALATVDVLRRGELDVCTVGIGGKQVTGAHGITVEADILEKDVSTDPLEAVVLPGGMPGTLNLEKSPIVQAAVRYAAENHLLVAAICAAPSVLGHMGLLEGKQAVCFPGFENQLTGAKVSSRPVWVDGNIVTGRGPGVSIEFGLTLVSQLKGAKTAEAISMSMQCM